MSGVPDRDTTALDFKLLHLIATVIDACDRQPSRGRGHPPSETIRVVATLRRFLREGTPWRSLSATRDQASALSSFHYRVEITKLDAGVIGRELPIGPGSGSVAP